MTETGGSDLDQQLTRSRPIEFDFFHNKRTALGIGHRLPLLIQYCGTDFHPDLLIICFADCSSICACAPKQVFK
jgi:hypothetical protein